NRRGRLVGIWDRLSAAILVCVTLLSDPEIDAKLVTGAWQRDGQAIAREWRFEDFVEAIAFVNRVADAAETANHHPDMHIHGWNKVRLELSTHSEGGLTQADFDMALRIDELA
ncbi:MAG TPA: 4a-hydroxytetrahydrobiopterin dehydratase, partial [Solirubrobacteraceae bacterium]|nr:4a-hydroxytetrahydrobiopterin dehydratase [Solirubrobacteraceae bacterium]